MPIQPSAASIISPAKKEPVLTRITGSRLHFRKLSLKMNTTDDFSSPRIKLQEMPEESGSNATTDKLKESEL